MRRRVLNALLGAGLLLGLAAPPVLAVDPIPGRPLPDEPPVTELTDLSTASLVVDLDGDGTREVLAIAALDELRGFAAVQAWWVDGSGSITESNQVRLRRSATFDDRVAIGNGIRIDPEGMTGVRLGEPNHLLTVQRDGREVALATGIGNNPELTGPCCLTVWEVTTAGPGEIGLDLVAEAHLWSQQLVVADLDADETDELIAIETDLESGENTAVLLTWDGSAYRVTRSTILDGTNSPVLVEAGDSDGVPGDDVLLVNLPQVGVDLEPNIVGELIRLTLRGGAFVGEDVPIDMPQGFVAARVLTLSTGPTIMTADGEFIALLQWPRDAPIEMRLLQPNRNGVPLAVLGSGVDTVVLAGNVGNQSEAIAGLHVFSAAAEQWTIAGADLRAGVFALAGGGALPIPAATWTSTGPISGGIPGIPEIFVFSGMQVLPTPGQDEPVSVEPMSLLPGHSIVGTAGPGGEWAVLSSVPSGVLGQSPWVVAVGGLGEAGSLELANTASILEPETDKGELVPTMNGVAPDPQRPGQLIVGSQAVDVEIMAPPRSRVWWSTSRTIEELTVGAGGLAHIRLLEAAGGDVEEGELLTRRIWVVTPAGHTYQGSWALRVYRQPPNLGIEDELPLLDFAPMARGRTLAGSTMTVNGEPATVLADGTFAVPLRVGIVPTEIRIVVTDPVGNRTERLVTRVWPLDYRQLPWVPIAVLLTVGAAAVLFLRQPESRAGRRLTPEDESTFEEIGG